MESAKISFISIDACGDEILIDRTVKAKKLYYCVSGGMVEVSSSPVDGEDLLFVVPQQRLVHIEFSTTRK